LTKEHTQFRTLKEVAYYPAHPDRTESDEFREIKREFKKEHAKCWINNGYCDGPIEVHHDVIEYSEAMGVDWEKVKKDYPNIDHVDDKDQMLTICKRHHTGKYTGKHNISEPIWKMQKYMDDESIAKFEAAVAAQIKKDQEGH
jgi:hypothetical protein